MGVQIRTIGNHALRLEPIFLLIWFGNDGWSPKEEVVGEANKPHIHLHLVPTLVLILHGSVVVPLHSVFTWPQLPDPYSLSNRISILHPK